MKVTVKVPATTANLGPGFDCLGMALPVYNTITIEEMVLPHSGIEINVFSEIDEMETISIPTDENNIAFKAVELLYNSIGQVAADLRITIQTQIPIARGLGSSASVIVGALIAANELLGRPADEAALLSIATEIEGHPDNIAPAILGGLILVSQECDDSIIYRRLNWPKNWKLTLCIPDYELSTGISRSVIPCEIPLKDVEFNLRRLGMFVYAVEHEDAELMKCALQDKIHQPYRQRLIPGFTDICDAFKFNENVLGCVLSGAGPSLLVVSKEEAIVNVKEKVSEIWTRMNIKTTIVTLPMEEKGAYVVQDERKIFN